MSHRMSPDFPTEHKLNAPNTPRISGSTKSRQSMPAVLTKTYSTMIHYAMNNVLILSRKCHSPGSAFEGPGRIPPSPRPKQIFESDSQSISPHNHQISSTIYSVNLYLKANCPKTYQNNTRHTKTHLFCASCQSLEQRQDGTSDLGTGGFSLQGHHESSQPGPPAVPKYSAKTSSPAAFGPATNGVDGGSVP